MSDRRTATAAEPDRRVASPRYETLAISERDGVGLLLLSRPEAANAMSPQMLCELPHATAWLADTAPFRALVVSGVGETFSCGGDLEILAGLAGDPEVDVAADSRERIDQLNRAILNLRRIRYPVVAAVNGLAAGSGFALALACDQRMASTRAVFSAGYGRLGLTPDGGLSYFLPRLLGEVRALSLLIADRRIKAHEAERVGLVGEVVQPDELLAQAHTRARRLAALSPRYTATVKRLIDESSQHTLAEHLQRERHAFADATASVDFLRGAEALFAGRRPSFRDE